jgi:hypothetical protein
VVSGGYAYVAASARFRLTIIDMSDPMAPVEIGFLNTEGPAFGVAMADVAPAPSASSGEASGRTYAYIAEGYRPTDGELTGGGLRVIDVSDPAAPAEAGFLDTPRQALSVAVAGPYAYVGDGDARWRVIDVSDPGAPVEVGSLGTQGPVTDTAIVGDLAYFTDGWGGSLRIIDLSDPAVPAEVGFYYTFGYADRVVVDGGYAFVADRDAGLYVVDVANPVDPIEAGFYEVSARITGLAVVMGHILVATDEGSYALEFSPPERVERPSVPTPMPLPAMPPASLFRPEGELAEWWATDEAVRRRLGWATAPEPASVAAAAQSFEGGSMLWREDERLIYVLFRDGTWRAFEDTWTEEEAESDPGLVVPEGRLQPIRGFGKVWRQHRQVRGRLGWSVEPERGHRALIHAFERGVLIEVGDAAFGLVEEAGQPAQWDAR